MFPAANSPINTLNLLVKVDISDGKKITFCGNTFGGGIGFTDDSGSRSFINLFNDKSVSVGCLIADFHLYKLLLLPGQLLALCLCKASILLNFVLH